MSALPIVQPFTRRGICPALSAPMQTGDGLLSRIALEEEISPALLGQICELALRHGNGLVDITARGSFQFRGLTTQSAIALKHDILALDLPLRQGIAVECSPLAGFDPAETSDARQLVTRIRERASALKLHERLAAKMSVIIDGGGQVQLDGLLADIRLKATRINMKPHWQLLVGGTEEKALHAGFCRDGHAADIVLELLCHLADLGDNARGRDLTIASITAICGDRLIQPIHQDTWQENALPYGLLPLANTRFAAGFAPAFGQISAKAIIAVCHNATALGIQTIRLGPAHGILAMGSENECQNLLAFARSQGFITASGDPRSAIAVCPGSPACASAFAPVQELAAFAASECASMLDGSFTLHLSGCGKGCAHPSPALLAVSGTTDGLAFGFSAKVSAIPDTVLPIAEQKAALSRLARLYEKEHKPGENARTLLARLGRTRLVAALRQDET